MLVIILCSVIRLHVHNLSIEPFRIVFFSLFSRCWAKKMPNFSWLCLSLHVRCRDFFFNCNHYLNKKSLFHHENDTIFEMLNNFKQFFGSEKWFCSKNFVLEYCCWKVDSSIILIWWSKMQLSFAKHWWTWKKNELKKKSNYRKEAEIKSCKKEAENCKILK